MTAGGPGAPAAPAATTQRTFRIVISYRRVDTGGDARSLAEALERRFGRDNVFLDIEAIEPGEPFDQAIDRAVAASDVLLALIGQHWLTLTDEEGRRRIDDPRDVVRLEVGSALVQNLRVIPVLLEDAKMPSEEDLPPELAAFSKRNAVELRATRWKVDVEDFVEELAALKRQKLRGLGPDRGWRRVLGPLAGAGGAVRRAAARNPRAAGAVALAAALVLAALVAVLVLRSRGDDGLPHPPLAADETLAFVSGGRIMLLDGDAEEPVPLSDPGTRKGVDWTADGRLVYSDGAIWISDRRGENEQQLTTGPNDGSPSVNRNGLVAFNRPETEGQRGPPFGIWVVEADGLAEPDDLPEPDDLQDGAGEAGAGPEWSPDGLTIAYQRRRGDSGGQHIWLMDVMDEDGAYDGANQRELLPDYDETALSAAWAPIGRRIAFVLPGESRCRIGIAREGQDRPEELLTPELPETCSEPAWSPDGRYLVVFVRGDGLWAIRVDDSEEPRRLLEIESAGSPTWIRRPG